MYWSSGGNSSKIEKAGLDGSEREIIITGSTRNPQHLAIDFSKNRLYWSDLTLGSIHSSDFTGNSRRTMILGARDVTGLDVFTGIIYWTTRNIFGGSSLRMSNTSDDGSQVELYNSSNRFLGMFVYNGQNQPYATKRCGENNGGCVQLCLPSPTGYSCHCADNEPVSNGTVCDQPSPSKNYIYSHFTF